MIRPAPTSLRLAATLLGLVCALAPAPARAQAFPRGEAATATALAGTDAASLSGPMALWHNPAALTRESAWSAAAALAIGLDGASVTEDGLLERDNRSGPLLSPLVAAQTPRFWGGKVVVALGYRLGWRRRIDLESPQPPGTGRLAPPSTRFWDQRLESAEHSFSLAVAARWRTLSFGAALELGYATLEGGRQLFAGAPGDAASKRDWDSAASWSLSGLSIGGRLGLLFEPCSWFRTGLTFELPRRLALEGDLELTPPLRPPSGSKVVESRDGSGEVTLRRAPALALGLALELASWLTAHGQLGLRFGGNGADLRVRDAALVLSGANAGEQLVDGIALQSEQRLALRWSLGLELSLLGGRLRCRGGWGYVQGSLEETSSLFVDADRHRLGMGVELEVGSLALEVAVSRTFAVSEQLRGRGAALVEGGTTDYRGALQADRTRALLGLRVRL